MSLLTTLLSGLREIRAPLTAGLLWLAALYVLVSGSSQVVVMDPVTAHLIVSGIKQWSSVLLPPLVAGSAYFLGSISVSIFRPLILLVGAFCRKICFAVSENGWRKARGGDYVRRRPKHFFSFLSALDLRVWPLTIPFRSSLIDAIRSSLVAIGVPGSAALFFPFAETIATLPTTAVQLSQSASIQYQEYQRLQSESELRIAIIPPLFGLALVVPLHMKVLVILATIAGICVLGAQAASSNRDSQNLLANAVYQGYIEIPAVKAVVSTLADVDPKPTVRGEWIGAIITALWHQGLFDEAHLVLEEVDAESFDGDWDYMKSYLDANCAELAAWWDRTRESIDS